CFFTGSIEAAERICAGDVPSHSWSLRERDCIYHDPSTRAHIIDGFVADRTRGLAPVGSPTHAPPDRLFKVQLAAGKCYVVVLRPTPAALAELKADARPLRDAPASLKLKYRSVVMPYKDGNKGDFGPFGIAFGETCTHVDATLTLTPK